MIINKFVKQQENLLAFRNNRLASTPTCGRIRLIALASRPYREVKSKEMNTSQSGVATTSFPVYLWQLKVTCKTRTMMDSPDVEGCKPIQGPL